jgi:hypothetical protein
MVLKIDLIGSVFLVGLIGCATSQTISPIVLGNGSLENIAGDDDDCGWVRVETARIGSTPELHYCCPGEQGGRPVCLEAVWTYQN